MNIGKVFWKISWVYIVILVLWIIRTIFSALKDYLKLKPRYSDKPIDSFIQVIMIVLWIVGLRLFYQGYLKLVIQSF
jgi:miniconductance mechanosensitive channel